jgi:hypothetical protein
MGKFSETAIVHYRLSFADQGKQTSVFPFPFSASSKELEVAIFRQLRFPYIYICSVSSPWRPHIEDKRMVLEHTHGLFIT